MPRSREYNQQKTLPSNLNVIIFDLYGSAGIRLIMSKSNLKKFNYSGYDRYLYTGLQGAVMRHNHRIISANVETKKNKKILEIGGAAKPHFTMVGLEGVEEYWVSDISGIHAKFRYKTNFATFKHDIDKDPEYNYFKKKNKKFSRIIASHVWEHVTDPEANLLEWVDLLEDDGQIDISIPCDPGLLWRIGQLIGRKKAMKTFNMTSIEIDLLMAREHINSCQNLKSIMKYYTNNSGKFFPFILPMIDLNLFLFFRASKSDFYTT